MPYLLKHNCQLSILDKRPDDFNLPYPLKSEIGKDNKWIHYRNYYRRIDKMQYEHWVPSDPANIHSGKKKCCVCTVEKID